MLWNQKNIYLTLFCSGLIFFDQLSKYIVRHSSGFYICNPDIAFGINIPPALFWIIWIIIIAIVGFQIFNFSAQGESVSGGQFSIFNQFSITNSKNYLIPLIFILSGAVSNIIDRLYFGCIIDFIDLKIWPVFNLADSFIVLGIILILLSQLRKSSV